MKDRFYVFEDECGEYDTIIVEAKSEQEAIGIVEINFERAPYMEIIAIYDSEEELDADGFGAYDIF